jgi:hypothetical protein
VTRYSRVIGVAWALAVMTLALAVVAWSTAMPVVIPEGSIPSHGRNFSVPVFSGLDTSRLSGSATNLREHDPFRFDRTAARVRFNPSGPVGQPGVAPPPAPPRPVIRLVGIIGGPPWTALVEGVPGRESGVLLRIGEASGGVRVTSLAGDSGVFAGFDTVWVLRVSTPWR